LYSIRALTAYEAMIVTSALATAWVGSLAQTTKSSLHGTCRKYNVQEWIHGTMTKHQEHTDDQ